MPHTVLGPRDSNNTSDLKGLSLTQGHFSHGHDRVKKKETHSNIECSREIKLNQFSRQGLLEAEQARISRGDSFFNRKHG